MRNMMVKLDGLIRQGLVAAVAASVILGMAQCARAEVSVSTSYSTSGFTVSTSQDLILGVLPTVSGNTHSTVISALVDGQAPNAIPGYDGNNVLENGVVLKWDLGAEATINEIQTYTAWPGDRYLQDYTVDVSTDGTTWNNGVISVVNQGTGTLGGWNNVKVSVTMSDSSPLATNVRYVRLNFNNQQNSAVGYTEIVINGVSSVSAEAPAFTSIPQSQTVTNGDSVTFTAAATGSPVPAIAWHFVDTNSVDHLLSTVGNTLTIASVNILTDVGQYYVAASNSSGTTNSTPAAVLTVIDNGVRQTVDNSGNAFAVWGIITFPQTQTLDGWHERAYVGGVWTDLGPDVKSLISTDVNGDLRGFELGGEGDATRWLRSPAFTLNARGDLTISVFVLDSSTTFPASDSLVPGTKAAGGFAGIALRDVSTGNFVLTKSAATSWIPVTFTAAELAPYVGQVMTVDIISQKTGAVFVNRPIKVPGTLDPTITNLIQGNSGTSVALNIFENQGSWTTGNLTDGNIGSPTCINGGSPAFPYGLIGNNGTITYNLGGACTITGVESWTGWNGGGRDNQDYTFSYSLDGSTFIPLWTVANHNTLPHGNDVSLAISGLTDVVSVRFTFGSNQANGGSAYTELAVYGISPTPPSAPIFTEIPQSQTVTNGDSVTFTAQATGFPAPIIAWHFVDTNSVDHLLATIGNTLTIASVNILSDVGQYYAVASSTQGTTNSPSALLTVISTGVTETSLSLTGGSFVPLAGNDLILGNAGVSSLSLARDVFTGTAVNLTDGVLKAPGNMGANDQVVYIENGSVTYSLGSGANGIGYDITGIRSLTVWANDGRINQHFTVSYSSDGVNFILLDTVNYTATPGANGTDVSLAIANLSKVKYIKFDFSGGQQNGGVGYTELAVFGRATVPKGTVLMIY